MTDGLELGSGLCLRLDRNHSSVVAYLGSKVIAFPYSSLAREAVAIMGAASGKYLLLAKLSCFPAGGGDSEGARRKPGRPLDSGKDLFAF